MVLVLLYYCNNPVIRMLLCGC